MIAMSLLLIIFSIDLHKVEVRAIGLYELGGIVGFPGFGIGMIILFVHSSGKKVSE